MKNLLLAGLALASLTFSTTGCANQKEKAETATAGTSAAWGGRSRESNPLPLRRVGCIKRAFPP